MVVENHLLGCVAEMAGARSVCKNRKPGDTGIRDQVVPVLGFLKATKSHLGTWNVLLGVFEVLELETAHQHSCISHRANA